VEVSRHDSHARVLEDVTHTLLRARSRDIRIHMRVWGPPGAPLCNLPVAVFGSVLQCVAMCCSVLQCVAVCCSVLQVCCSVLQYVAVCCSVVPTRCSLVKLTWCSVLLFFTMYCNVFQLLQCTVVCCSVLQCVARCCSVL